MLVLRTVILFRAMCALVLLASKSWLILAYESHDLAVFILNGFHTPVIGQFDPEIY
jgi:hypothetical protein